MLMIPLHLFQVIKTTGFMKGLYTDAEMNSENVKVSKHILASTKGYTYSYRMAKYLA